MKETWKMIALLAVAIGGLLAYAFIPEQVASVSWLFDYHDFVVIHNNITNYIFLCHIIIFLSYYLYAKHIINVGVREYTLL